MKIKNKLILGATSILVLSGVSAATSTFAWYTANRRTTLSLTNVGASAATSNLTVTYDDLDPRNLPASTEDPTVALADGENHVDDAVFSISYTHTLTDASSDGSGSFVKPMFTAEQDTSIGEEAGFWSSESAFQARDGNATQSWYHEFTLAFQVNGSETVSLYLSPIGTNAEDTTEPAIGDLSTNSAIRFSATSDAAGEGNNGTMLYASPNSDIDSYLDTSTSLPESGVAGDVSTDGTATLLASDFFSRTSNFSTTDLTTNLAEPVGDEISYNDPTTGYLGTLIPVSGTSNIINITFYTWIEGTVTVNNDNNDLEGAYDLNLKFYTINHSGMNTL